MSMSKTFNVSADCKPELHYMVDIGGRLREIKRMVDRGDYFTINRARQYGKTTTLKALKRYLIKEYIVISLDFQKMSHEDFRTENLFVRAFSGEVLKKADLKEVMPRDIRGNLQRLKDRGVGIEDGRRLAELFECFSEWCEKSKKPIVLIIDEVDSATNNQVFLDFLGQMRGYYIERDERAAFHSVILSGVYDVKNLKRKFVRGDEHKMNSPWNIAADFLVDMSFSQEDIAGMLADYEKDYSTGMDIGMISGLIYDYTSGYPYLVSRICKLIDERLAGGEGYSDKASAWSETGVTEAVKILLGEKNTLFESLVGKLSEDVQLRSLIYALLFSGRRIPYNPLNSSIETAEMFGIIKQSGGNAVISNRIFETVLYNLFLGEEMVDSAIYKAALLDKNQYLENGRLNMRMILEKFVVHFHDLYGNRNEEFLEEVGRRYFLLYLKPIINGVGNYYIEARTRDMERTDVIVDYRGEQFVIELKIWRGNAYHERGEKQLWDYLDYYHLKKGYMLSFNFNKKKELGAREIVLGDKVLVEAVV